MNNRIQDGSSAALTPSGRFSRLVTFSGLLAVLLLPQLSWAGSRIKDLAALDGVRDNELTGYGLVVGLNGTGDSDQAKFPTQTLNNLLARSGITIGRGEMTVKNVAAVLVTATLPPFARQGTKIDLTVSSLGDAKSLAGGTLVRTELKGVDERVYALASGTVVTGTLGTGKGHATAGRVLSGALVERELPDTVSGTKSTVLNLNAPDFTTASRIAAAINGHFQPGVALARNPGMIDIKVPERFLGEVVNFYSELESLEVEPDVVARVVVDEKSGTVVMGSDVRIGTCAIAHAGVSVKVVDQVQPSRPQPGAKAEVSHTAVLKGGASIGDLVRSLNTLGVSPRDLVVILQSLKASGALKADIVVI